MARCALMAYNYQPLQVPPSTLDFKGSYQTAAKQLWLRDAAATAGQGAEPSEEELHMPDAVACGGVGRGTEDRPHYDEVCGMV